MSTETSTIPRHLQPIDAALRRAMQTRSAREEIASALLVTEPERLGRAAAVRAIVEAGVSVLQDAAVYEPEEAEDELEVVDMAYYRESRV